ncbi:acyl-CoA dehydrogenase family protein [Rhodococcoides yunnanense]|uniref:acyl-CoA dehydrogenase family protein n=1 Tax=Rhodococcoides yunnanense TaxID=278209 RepID=UPI00093353D7|nr:acyl-CoA dehydrogenase family protein [Rhodococcus yunnanensis]
MSSNDVRELSDQIFARSDRNGSGFDADMWKACTDSGLTSLTGREDLGGSGGTLLDSAALLTSAGSAAVRVPLLESDLLAGWALDRIGFEQDRGVSTAAVAESRSVSLDSAGAVHGTVKRVPWARDATHIVLILDDTVIVVDARDVRIDKGTNVAEESRDDVVLEAVKPVAVGPVDPGLEHEFALRSALGKSLMMAGALEFAVDVATEYATQRVQFGRPIAKLQSVQQQLALAVGEAMAAGVAAHAAARIADETGVASAAWAIASAKVRCGLAAATASRISHQTMGAIGFTREHHLRLYTTRLWAWRAEGGSDAHWSRWLGEQLTDRDASELWASVVAGK